MKPRGRLVVSDIVSGRKLSAEIKNNLHAWACCFGGALEQQEYLEKVKESGFKDVQVMSSKEFYIEDEGSQALTKLLSITVKTVK